MDYFPKTLQIKKSYKLADNIIIPTIKKFKKQFTQKLDSH